MLDNKRVFLTKCKTELQLRAELESRVVILKNCNVILPFKKLLFRLDDGHSKKITRCKNNNW